MKKDLNNYEDMDLWVLLSRTYHSIAELRNAESRQSGAPRQAYILFIIKTLGNNVTLTEISRYTFRKKNSLSELINRMAAKGLVRKVRDPDVKSRIRVSLTKNGLRAYEKCTERESINKVMSALPEEKRQQLQSCLEILLEKALKLRGDDRKNIILPSQLATNPPLITKNKGLK